jgi:hypothetical protein
VTTPLVELTKASIGAIGLQRYMIDRASVVARVTLMDLRGRFPGQSVTHAQN